jgi:predicted ATPase with chaperone activity
METVQEKIGKIPERVVTLDWIAGMEASKRTLEVALAGAHPIVFLYNSNSHAVELVRA